MTHAVGLGADQPRRRVLFVGNRSGVFEAALELPELAVEWTWAVAGSALAARLAELGRPFEAFEPGEAPRLVDALDRTPFDLLVSNGCPIVLPVDRLARLGRLFVNVHPSPLPEMRGRHPVNGAVLRGRSQIGATMHFMSGGVDTGRTIAQERVDITDDLDLGLLYHIAFRLEVAVFTEGMRALVDSGFSLAGTEQAPVGSHYSRRAGDMSLDLATMDDMEILTRVRAFGVRTQGAVCRLGGRTIRVFDARLVRNPYLLAEFDAVPPGELALDYDEKLLVRTRQGLVALTSFAVMDECAEH
jgi:methionyl-tRNA formyltransferase